MAYVDDFPTTLPSSTDPANFDTRADAYYGHLPTFVDQLNALALLLSAAAAPPIAIPYVFSTTTTVADPGAGLVRLNNATQTSATALLADLVDGIGTTVTGLLDQFDDSTSTVKGYLRLTKVGDETKWLVFAVTAVASPSGYRNITIGSGVGSSASPFADGDNVTLTFVRNGDKGDTGPAFEIRANFEAFEVGSIPSAATTGRKTRLLDTVRRNADGWAFSSNQLTLPPGDYVVMATAPCDGIGSTYLALRNVTDSSDVVVGPNTSANQVGGYSFSAQPMLPMMSFTLAATKTVRLEHDVGVTGGTLSYAGNGAWMAIWKRG